MAVSTVERGVVGKRIDASISTCDKNRYALQTELEVFIALSLLPGCRKTSHFLPVITYTQNIRRFQNPTFRPSSLTTISPLSRGTIRPINRIEKSIKEVEAPVGSIKDFENCDVLRVNYGQSYFDIGV